MDGTSLIKDVAPLEALEISSAIDFAKARRFEQLIVPHLKSAHNLARWLVRNSSDAEDIVQEACLRAYRYLDGFEGGDPTGWLLAIVRNACFSWMKRKRRREEFADTDATDEEPLHDDATPVGGSNQALSRDPETLLIERRDELRLRELIGRLPPEQRDVVVLRDLEGLSYREIADMVGVPLGTVMSRLCRARRLLQERWVRPPPRRLEAKVEL